MNRKMLLGGVLGVAAAMLLAGCHPPATPPVDTAKIADAVKADAEGLVADLNARDAVKAVAHNAPGSVVMFHGAPNIGPDVDLVLTKQMVTDPALRMALSNETVDVAASGDMAVFRASYTSTATDPKTKKPMTETGNWLAGYKQQSDGSWKIVWSIGADTPPAAPAPKT